MSLFVHIGTRSAPRAKPPLPSCPEINVRFVVDSISLLLIIRSMKGLNWHAPFCLSCSSKKSLYPALIEEGFFEPGEPRCFHLKTWFPYSVAGYVLRVIYVPLHFRPAIVFIVTLFRRSA